MNMLERSRFGIRDYQSQLLDIAKSSRNWTFNLSSHHFYFHWVSVPSQHGVYQIRSRSAITAGVVDVSAFRLSVSVLHVLIVVFGLHFSIVKNANAGEIFEPLPVLEDDPYSCLDSQIIARWKYPDHAAFRSRLIISIAGKDPLSTLLGFQLGTALYSRLAKAEVVIL